MKSYLPKINIMSKGSGVYKFNFTMIPVLIFLIKLNWRIAVVLIKYFTKTLPTRKCHGGLIRNLKMAIYKTSLELGPKHAYYVNVFSNKTLVQKVMPVMYKNVVNDMPNYGEQFDERSMWLAKQETKTPKSSVIVYLHGGGYFLQTQPMQLAMICTLYKLVNKATRSNLNILFLDYKLVSEGEYPLPYQVIELYKTYVNLVNAGYEDIQLLGDSAGGNIAICFTQYLYMLYNKLPDSNINTTLEISKQIYPSELILVSPWVKLLPDIADIYTPGKSWHDNEKYDIITHNLGESIKHIVKTAKLDHLLVSPGNAKAEVEDWLRIPLFSDPKLRLFVLFGEDESFRDDIIDWCENALGVPSETFAAKNRQYSYTKFDKSKSKCQVEIHMEPYGIHDSLFFFEDDAAIALRQKKPLDINKYYGLTRVVDFVNRHFE